MEDEILLTNERETDRQETLLLLYTLKQMNFECDVLQSLPDLEVIHHLHCHNILPLKYILER